MKTIKQLYEAVEEKKKKTRISVKKKKRAPFMGLGINTVVGGVTGGPLGFIVGSMVDSYQGRNDGANYIKNLRRKYRKLHGQPAPKGMSQNMLIHSIKKKIAEING